jgi:hypothetical protein
MSLQNDIDKAKAALRDPKVTSFTYKGKRYTLTEVRDKLIPDLEKQLTEQGRAEAAAETEAAITKNEIDAARKRVQEADLTFLADSRAFGRKRLSEAQLNKSRENLTKAQQSLAQLLVAAPPSPELTAARKALRESERTSSTGIAPSTQQTTPDTAEEARFARIRAGMAPIEKPDSETTTPKAVTKSDVTAGLTAAGLADTPENRQLIRQQLETGKKPVAPAEMPNWEDEVRRNYAKYAWMLDDLDRAKYSDVFDLLKEAVNPQTKITDPAVFLARFEATSWYQELATKQMGRKVRAQVGALSFDPSNYAKFLNNAMRMGWEDDVLKSEAYKEVFRRNDDGSFANPNAVGEARKSSDYLSIGRIGSAYLSQMSDDRIIETLTGTTTQDDLLRIYREKAKVNNPHLAAAIDAGVTLEDLAYDYRKAASDVLGLPLNAVPLSEDFLGQALKTGEPGKYRVMTTNEWKTQLKSNPDYGYQFTANARKEVNDVVQKLEKAFGLVR